MFNFCFPFQMICHLVFNGGNPEKSQLVCRIKVPHLLLHLIKCSKRLFAKGALKYLFRIECSQRLLSKSTLNAEKKGFQCWKRGSQVLTMPRALSASSPTRAPETDQLLLHQNIQIWFQHETPPRICNKPVNFASKYQMQILITVETPTRMCIHSSIIPIVVKSLCFCQALNFW